MALADSVPGVSGGTIAFLLGFYDKFIGSLDAIVAGKKAEKIDGIKFLIKIGIGWITGFVISMLFLGSIFEAQIYNISSLFLGFIIFAIPIIIKEEKESLIDKYKNVVFLIGGIIIVSAITYFNPATKGGMDISIDRLSIGLGVYVFVVGMIAISAMVLPGISGSTLLLIFGLYVPIVSAVKEVITFNFEYLPIVMIFGFGVLGGIFATIRIVKYVLNNYRSQTIYMILGLMIGSLYAVVMGPASLEIPKPPMTFSTFSIMFFIIGGILILGLQQMKNIFDKNKKI
jgi:putative membrane protein